MSSRLLARVRGIVALPSENLLARFVTMNMLGTAGSLIIGLATSIMLARFLGPSGRGLLGLMLSVNQLVVVLASIGLPTAVTYFASLPDSDPPAILGNCLIHAEVMAAVLIPLTAFLRGPIANAFGHGHGGRTWILVAALVPLTFLDWTTNSQLQGTLRFARFNLVVIAARLTYAVGVLILVGVLGLGVAGGVIATGIGAIVMIVASLAPILERGAPRIDPGLMKRMFGYGWRAQVGAILQLAYGRLDVIILELYRPLAQVGYYVVAQTIAELVLTLAQEFRWTSMVLVTKYEGDTRQADTTADSVRHYGILAIAAAIGNVAFGSLVILVAYGQRFSPAITPMLVLLPGVYLLGLAIVIQGDLSGRGRPGLASALSGVAAVITTALDFALIPPFGMIGAALASVVGYSALGISSLIALQRVSGVAMRDLVVPTRADLAVYRNAILRLVDRLRGGKDSDDQGGETPGRGR